MKELKIGNYFWGIQRGDDRSNRTIVNGKIISINEIRNKNGELVKYIELDNGFAPSQLVNVDDIYESGDEVMNAYQEEVRHMIEEYKSTINTVNDLIIFMFNNGVGHDKYYEDYEVYQTVIEKTRELLGVELKRKLPCNYCHKISLYKTCEKPITKEALGVEYTYLEKYGVCENCGCEICVPEYYEENVKRMHQAYRDAESKKKEDKHNEERVNSYE